MEYFIEKYNTYIKTKLFFKLTSSFIIAFPMVSSKTRNFQKLMSIVLSPHRKTTLFVLLSKVTKPMALNVFETQLELQRLN